MYCYHVIVGSVFDFRFERSLRFHAMRAWQSVETLNTGAQRGHFWTREESDKDVRKYKPGIINSERRRTLGLLNTSIVRAVLLSHCCGQNLYWEFCKSSTKRVLSVYEERTLLWVQKDQNPVMILRGSVWRTLRKVVDRHKEEGTLWVLSSEGSIHWGSFYWVTEYPEYSAIGGLSWKTTRDIVFSIWGRERKISFNCFSVWARRFLHRVQLNSSA